MILLIIKRNAKKEQKEYKSKTTISDESLTIISVITIFLVVIVFLFVMLGKALEDSRDECESQGKEFNSTYAGKSSSH